MPVIAVINRKGGSGKSTVATHLATWFARDGKPVMLGDVDRQQSARAWLRRRNPMLPSISSWAVDQGNMLRVPKDITHVVLDTPGGLRGLELAKIVMQTDVILIPVCNSAFDRESAAACYAELQTLPRVANGRCVVAGIGMRIDSRTHGAQELEDWAKALNLPFLGVLRETQLYVQCLERGMAVFDLSPSRSATDVAQWQPLLDWLTPLLHPVPVSKPLPAESGTVISSLAGSALPDKLMPAQEAMFSGGRLAVSRPHQTAANHPRVSPLAVSHQTSGDRQVPAFLQSVH